jgi:hypothetical protein
MVLDPRSVRITCLVCWHPVPTQSCASHAATHGAAGSRAFPHFHLFLRLSGFLSA